MEPSPLTQVLRPDFFQPKIVRLYETLFRVRVLLRTCPAFYTQLMVDCRKMTRTTSYPTASGRSSSSTGRTTQGYGAS